MAEVRIEAVCVQDTDPRFWDLLSISVGYPTPEKMERVRGVYRNEPGRGLARAVEDGNIVGVAGYVQRQHELELTHLAVPEDRRGAGFARAMIAFIGEQVPHNPVVAETHEGAVGFYQRIAFTTASLPLKEPGWVPRFHCRKAPSNPNGN